MGVTPGCDRKGFPNYEGYVSACKSVFDRRGWLVIPPGHRPTALTGELTPKRKDSPEGLSWVEIN